MVATSPGNNYLASIEKKLDQLILPSSPYYASLLEGGRYSLLSPGKRIRPLLTLLTTELFSKENIDKALVPACALEIVHTYSLIHDDLPCMDDDDFRRGRPTLHRVYNEAHAVLVGDFLLTHAFEILAKDSLLSPEQKVECIRSLATAAGAEGMVGGQVMDLEGKSELRQIHLQKTAALFGCALELGGIVSTLPFSLIQSLHTFGLQFGLLFQMIDDIVDRDHPLGEEKALAGAELLYREAMAQLDSLPYDTSKLRDLTTSVYTHRE